MKSIAIAVALCLSVTPALAASPLSVTPALAASPLTLHAAERTMRALRDTGDCKSASVEPACRSGGEAALASPSTSDSTGAITGTISSRLLATGVGGALVAIDHDRTPSGAPGHATVSDSTGAYALTGIRASTVMVQVTRPGYDTASVEVTVPAGGMVHVDVILEPVLVMLDSIRVQGVATAPVVTGGNSGGGIGPNVWQWSRPLSDATTSTGEPDLLRVLGQDPHFGGRPDWPSTLSDRGGTPDQLLIRLDGLPLWNPVHASGALAAVTPDAIAGVTVHDGALPAAYGDRLGGVVDLATPDPTLANGSAQLGFGPAAARGMWTNPLTVGGVTANILVAGRVSNASFSPMRVDVAGLRDQWADGVARATVRWNRSTLELLGAGSSDRTAPVGGLVADSMMLRSPVPWHTQTLGMVWTQRLQGDAHLQVHLSSAAFGAAVPSLGGSHGPSLESGARQSEATAELGLGATAVGISVDALSLRYRVVNTGPPAVGPPNPGVRPTPLDLSGSPTIVAAYAEHTWGPADSAWRVSTGVRASTLTGATPRLEPRVAGALRLTDAVTLTAAVARTHQYVQSLRNTSSPAGAQLGLDLPVAAKTGGLPIAQGDAATVGVVTNLPAGTRLLIDGYIRHLAGLAAVNPDYPNAFATTDFARASAHVTGTTLELDGGTRRLSWNASYGWGMTTEWFPQLSHQPTTQIGQSLQVGLGWQFEHATQLRIANWAALGRTSSDVGGMMPAHDDDAPGEETSNGHGSASMWLPMANMPAYLRTDVSVVRDWRLGHGTGRFSAFVTLANAFNHANVALVIPHGPGAATTPITLLPRTLLAGASVGY